MKSENRNTNFNKILWPFALAFAAVILFQYGHDFGQWLLTQLN